MKFSLFNNSYDQKPNETLSIEELIKRIKEGYWKKQVLNLRGKKNTRSYKQIKEHLPGVTISVSLKNRDKLIPVNQRIKEHSGLLCLDVDKKDNPKLKAGYLVDTECLAQFTSCGGEGIKIIYRCKQTKDKAEHRRIYDAAVLRLQKKGIKLKVDPIVKSIVSLQYVSYDPDAYYIAKSKLVIQPLPVQKTKVRAPSEDVKKEIEQLKEYIELLGDKDITKEYDDWLNLAFGLSYSLGEHGRASFHSISKNYDGYSKSETDDLYDSCLERSIDDVGKPITIASVFQLINNNLPKVHVKNLAKKFNAGHAIGVGEEEENGKDNTDLSGMVRFNLFLFKKVIDKEAKAVSDLIPHEINLNSFEALLKEKGFFRFGKTYVHVVNNIVSIVDTHDIIRIVTDHIEQEGDYNFSYKGLEYHFSWEELIHLWRSKRGSASMHNQVTSSLTHWVPNLLKDTSHVSYIPYLNGVVEVTDKTIKLLSYEKINMQVWKERILPREFIYTKDKGMFEVFFENVCGRGTDSKQRRASEAFKRSLWYFGYMLQGTKRQSTARAWLLYDIKAGNSGRTGKSIIGQAVGKIRSMVTLDGKRIDFTNRFAFQAVNPWTDVVFIDDPSKYMSIQPLFNMITGDLEAEAKNAQPIIKQVKFMFASNWILESEGQSESGRQYVTQVDDFYVRWGKENGDTITPIVDYHGKEFFTDWDYRDWNKFDSFCMSALQYHLREKSPANTIIGNAKQVRFIQVYENDLFYALSHTLLDTMSEDKNGNVMVPQGTLVNIVKEYDSKVSSIKAGKIVKEYLSSIGATGVSVTTIVVANMNRMAYRLDGISKKQLQFGDHGKNLNLQKYGISGTITNPPFGRGRGTVSEKTQNRPKTPKPKKPRN